MDAFPEIPWVKWTSASVTARLTSPLFMTALIFRLLPVETAAAVPEESATLAASAIYAAPAPIVDYIASATAVFRCELHYVVQYTMTAQSVFYAAPAREVR